MRRKIHPRIKDSYTAILLILLLGHILVISNPIYAQEEQKLLIVNLDMGKYTVEANEKFSVVVKDEDENSVKDATVYIQSVYGASGITNKDGRVWLEAPGDRTEITIIAKKEGYQDGFTTVMVNIPLSLWDSIRQSPYTPVVIAVILLILAVIFVNLRHKRSVDSRAKEISNEQILRRYGVHGKILSEPSIGETGDRRGLAENVHIVGKRGPKVEEIRISRPRKDKDVVSVGPEEEENRKAIDLKILKKHDYDWFEGTDDVRYEIDRITGEIDEEGIDKWFEGIDDIRAKIDEKVKKKDKNKDR